MDEMHYHFSTKIKFEGIVIQDGQKYNFDKLNILLNKEKLMKILLNHDKCWAFKVISSKIA